MNRAKYLASCLDEIERYAPHDRLYLLKEMHERYPYIFDETLLRPLVDALRIEFRNHAMYDAIDELNRTFVGTATSTRARKRLFYEDEQNVHTLTASINAIVALLEQKYTRVASRRVESIAEYVRDFLQENISDAAERRAFDARIEEITLARDYCDTGKVGRLVNLMSGIGDDERFFLRLSDYENEKFKLFKIFDRECRSNDATMIEDICRVVKTCVERNYDILCENISLSQLMDIVSSYTDQECAFDETRARLYFPIFGETPVRIATET